jgi:hypothetical protein
VEDFCEILSRVVFRLSVAQRREVLDLALMLYRSPIQVGPSFNDGLSALFRRVLYAMSQAETLVALGDIVPLPIPAVDGFVVPFPESWPEPAQFITPVSSAGFERPAAWRAAIDKLLSIAEHQPGIGRRRALLRLYMLYRCELLTERESEAFGRALWGRTDASSNLPTDLPFLESEILTLPEREPGLSKSRLRAYLLRGDFRRSVQRSVAPDGREIKQTALMFGSDRYVLNLLNATAVKWLEPDDRRIDWSTAEAIELLQKAIELWDAEKNEIPSSGAPFSHDLRDTIREQMSHLVDVMAYVVLPRLTESDSEAVTTAQRFLIEAERSGIATLTALPAVLHLRPGDAATIAQRIRRGLNSLDETDIRSAVNGVHIWLLQSRGGAVPPAPHDLLDELIRHVVSRREPGLLIALRVLGDVVARRPELFGDRQVDDLSVALEYLAAETALSLSDQTNSFLPVETRGTIPLELRPEYRAAAARLAAVMRRSLFFDQASEPASLRLWDSIAENDPLPEVRRAWTDL